MTDQNTDAIVEQTPAVETVPDNIISPEQVNADEELSKFLGEPVKNGAVIEEPKKEETTPSTSVEPTKEEPKAPEAPTIDEDRLTDKITKQLEEKLMPKGATKEDKIDILANAPWTKENRNPSWEEALKYMADVNKEQTKKEILAELNKEVEDEEKKEADAKLQAEHIQEETNKKWGTIWDTQFRTLETEGKIPKVVNAQDNNDAGKKARLQIYESMREQVQAAIQRGENPEPYMNVELTFFKHYKAPGTQPAGSDAPIAGVTKTVTANDNTNFKYSEVKNKSFEDLLSGV